MEIACSEINQGLDFLKSRRMEKKFIGTERPILSSKRCPFAVNEAVECTM